LIFLGLGFFFASQLRWRSAVAIWAIASVSVR
jgi:hypothetical protein